MNTSDKDIVVQARAILTASNAYTLRIQVRELLGALADEVERLREIEERHNEAVESGLILDEDHHANF